MAVTKIHRTSRMTLYATVVVTLIVFALFLFGGQVPLEQRIVPDMSQPAFTDVLLYWMYILLAITIVILLLFAIVGFLNSFRTNPKKAVSSLLVLVGLAAMFIIFYMLGSGAPLDIVGYEGKDNVPKTLKITDMWIFSIYAMLGLTILAILISPVLKRRK